MEGAPRQKRLDSDNGDLWHKVFDLYDRMCHIIEKIKSHMTAATAIRNGRPKDAYIANAVADQAAETAADAYNANNTQDNLTDNNIFMKAYLTALRIAVIENHCWENFGKALSKPKPKPPTLPSGLQPAKRKSKLAKQAIDSSNAQPGKHKLYCPPGRPNTVLRRNCGGRSTMGNFTSWATKVCKVANYTIVQKPAPKQSAPALARTGGAPAPPDKDEETCQECGDQYGYGYAYRCSNCVEPRSLCPVCETWHECRQCSTKLCSSCYGTSYIYHRCDTNHQPAHYILQPLLQRKPIGRITMVRRRGEDYL